MCVDFAFLDSGTGGIPYMLELKKKMPEAKCLYLGDTANFPYGEKTPEKITDCAVGAVKLINRCWHPKTLIVACNTISVTSLADLRKTFPKLSIVGTVPAIKLAASVTKNKRIGFLATNAAVNNPYSKRLISDFASDCKVFSRGDPDLIAFIEHDLFTATEEERLNAVRPAVDYFLANDCDTIILGCTHFTQMADYVKKAAGPSVNVVDSREGVSNQALKVESEISFQPALAPQECSASEALFSNWSFFITAATPAQKDEYLKMCSRFNIPYGGIIS